MQSSRQYPIPYSTPRTVEKQRFSINGSATHGQIIPIYMNQQEKYQSHDYLSAFGAIIRNARRRIWHRFQWHQRTHLTSHSKELPSPASPSSHSTSTFIFLCALWYSSSALSSNTGKAILNQFRYPVTLTFVQFGFVASYCLLFMSPVIRFSKLRAPSKAILRSTLPMGMFQVGGHMFSSMAISRIPVSTVHTIKVIFLMVLSYGE
jgi:solute carrier family 35 protein E1